MTAVLIVASAARYWTLADGKKHLTGVWAEELTEPHRIFSKAGWHITLATPGAVAPTIDASSLAMAGTVPGKRKRLQRYLDSHTAEFSRPKAIEDIWVGDFDAVFYPGGHAPMEDLAVDTVSGALLTEAMRAGIPVCLLCHGPAAALAATNPDGSWPFAGYRMTALSNREERLNRFARNAKWLLEDRLVERGACYVKRRIPLAPYVVADGNLYTGQNPASAARLANRLVADLGRRR